MGCEWNDVCIVAYYCLGFVERLVREDRVERLVREDRVERVVREDRVERVVREDRVERVVCEDCLLSVRTVLSSGL